MSSFQKKKTTSTCLTYPSENYSDFDAWSFSEHTSLEQEQPPALMSFIAPGDGSVFSRAARGIVMGAPFLGDRENGVGLEMKWKKLRPYFCSALSVRATSCSRPQKLSIMVLTHVQIHGAAWPSMSTLWIMKKSTESREFRGEDRGDHDGRLRSPVLWPLLSSLAHYTFYCLSKTKLYCWFWCLPSLTTLAKTDLFKILYDPLKHKC